MFNTWFGKCDWCKSLAMLFKYITRKNEVVWICWSCHPDNPDNQ